MELPNSGQRVVIHWINSNGKQRTSMGFYAAKYTVSAEDWDYEAQECADYNEEDDQHYCPEGWHEEMHESEYFYPIGGEVVGWENKPEFKTGSPAQKEG